MAILRRTAKTGKMLRVVALLACFVGALTASAETGKFTAHVDRTQVGLDDSVSLKLSYESQGDGGRVGTPNFQAPDFEVINEFTGSFVQSYYDSSSGQFGTRNTQSLTKVLRPLKKGKLRIFGIQMTVDGRVLKAPDILV